MLLAEVSDNLDGVVALQDIQECTPATVDLDTDRADKSLIGSIIIFVVSFGGIRVSGPRRWLPVRGSWLVSLPPVWLRHGLNRLASSQSCLSISHVCITEWIAVRHGRNLTLVSGLQLISAALGHNSLVGLGSDRHVADLVQWSSSAIRSHVLLRCLE